ncbi:MAG: hypothetical protein Q8Q85_00075 [Gemmatimonadales bacterium]|nr:hypothetical protein [Gemmatimonadales bacterium]
MGVADRAVGLSAGQLAAARVIEREFVAAKYPPGVIAAAIVNAYAESGLNPAASGDKARSIGLFQLHEKGAGAGMTAAQRADPVTNTRRILGVVQGSYGRRLRELALLSGGHPAAVAKLAAVFSTDIERPANTALAEMHRAALAWRLFPLGVEAVPTRAPVPAGSTRSAPFSLWWVTGGVTLVIALAVLIARARARPSSPGVTP